MKLCLITKTMFTSEEPIEDNDAKEMKRRSKIIEWAFITHKAKKLLELPLLSIKQSKQIIEVGSTTKKHSLTFKDQI